MKKRIIGICEQQLVPVGDGEGVYDLEGHDLGIRLKAEGEKDKKIKVQSSRVQGSGFRVQGSRVKTKNIKLKAQS